MEFAALLDDKPPVTVSPSGSARAQDTNDTAAMARTAPIETPSLSAGESEASANESRSRAFLLAISVVVVFLFVAVPVALVILMPPGASSTFAHREQIPGRGPARAAPLVSKGVTVARRLDTYPTQFTADDLLHRLEQQPQFVVDHLAGKTVTVTGTVTYVQLGAGNIATKFYFWGARSVVVVDFGTTFDEHVDRVARAVAASMQPTITSIAGARQLMMERNLNPPTLRVTVAGTLRVTSNSTSDTITLANARLIK
jgi:hypothetical protein